MPALTNLDYIKLAAIGPVFLVLAPALGFWLKGKHGWQLAVFALMCFMTLNGLLGPGNWGLTLCSIETYRGHAKGYHFFFNHALAIALIVANWSEDRKSFRWLPPGLGWFLIYCGVSLLSLGNAVDKNLALMAAHKTIFGSVLMIATFNTLRTEDDFKFFLRVMLCTMLWELFVCLKLKYLGHMYQVRGTFEHQNPLAMYSLLIAMVFLAAGLGPQFKGANWIMLGFGACAIIVECTLSRGALAMFALGTMGTIGLSLSEKITPRRLIGTAAMGIMGVIGIVLALDSIVSRFHDQGNQASGELREVMKDASREMVKDNPLGGGWNNYGLLINLPYRYADIYYDWYRGRGQKPDYTKANGLVESHYYLLIAENGYVGLDAWLVVIVVGLWRNVRAFLFFGHSFLRCMSLGIFMGCALNYVQSTLERVLVQPRNLMLWLILLGVTARIEVMRREAKQKKRELPEGQII
ncbi:MAG: hypothetical protein WCS94_00950 [Verrucomicrobiota bacterium]